MESYHVKNYIVRIYRYDRDNPRKLVGIVEQVGAEGERAFRTLDELWNILCLGEKGKRQWKEK